MPADQAVADLRAKMGWHPASAWTPDHPSEAVSAAAYAVSQSKSCSTVTFLTRS
jgi:hypothetical protein